MNITFNPTKAQLKGGTKSFMSYHNPRFKKSMYQFFGVKNGEEIIDIEIREDGISATFDYKGEK